MEYIMINEEKLKVMLDKGDLNEWDIEVTALDYSNPEAKTVFDDILQYAKEALGFDTAGHKVLLQLYPSRDGGCELFITRLPIPREYRQTRQDPQKAVRAYSFERLSYIISVCKNLLTSRFEGESSAWADDYGKWYLLLSDNSSAEINELPIPNAFSFISEYGESENSRIISLYLGEYAQPICTQNAVEILGKL